MNGPVVAVGAIVVDGDRLLLVRRGRPPGADRWSVPGGRVERDETLRDAVRREVREETGLELQVDAFAGWVERIGEGAHFVILDFYAHVTGDRRDPVAADDAAEARWVPLAEVGRYELVEGLAAFLREIGSLPA